MHPDSAGLSPRPDVQGGGSVSGSLGLNIGSLDATTVYMCMSACMLASLH